MTSGAYTLRAFSGRRVRYAFPDSWLEGGGSQGLTPTELISLIEKTDLLYELMADTLGGEPRGEGLMTIGVIPLTNVEGGAIGLATLGTKRCEISSGLLALTKSALAEGRLEGTIIHEVAHTFDLYRAHIGYYPDSSHSWTEFWIQYAAFLQRTGPYRIAPDLTLETTIYNFNRKWDTLATSATWERCVKPGSVCEAEGIPANRASTALLLKYARLHGLKALKFAFQFYKQYVATADPVTAVFLPPEQKNDVFAEALSFGIQADVSGEFDAWFWPVSAAAREKLRRTYSQPNPFVTDADGDGWSLVRGDTDDHDPSVHPGARETVNGKDDDGNGFEDDVARTAGPTLFTPPAKLVGRLRPEQSEFYRFEGAGEFLIRTRATKDEWGGRVEIRREGEEFNLISRFVILPSMTLSVLRLESSGPWVLKVTYSQTSGPEGDYEIIIAPMLSGPEGAGNVFALPLRASNSAREHALVPGGLARAVGTLPGANAAQADARADAQGRWPTLLSGIEVRVAGQPATVLMIRPTGGDGYSIDFVVPAGVTPAAMGSRVPVVVRHLLSGAQWRLDSAELLDSAPVLWGRQRDGETVMSAIALESPTLVAFNEANRVPVGGETRVMLFVSGLGVNRTPGNTRLSAKRADESRVQLPIEHIGNTSLPGLHQIIFKVDAALTSQPRVLLSVEGGEEAWVALYLR
jgi:uncharacterized protein (TIGR03437 family)